MKQIYFAHSGVKGMKWGVRRYQNKDGSLTPAGKKRYNYHDDYNKAHDKKSVKEMSDAELQKRNKRLNMEKQYKDLTKKKSIGKKIVTAFIASGTTITAVTAAATAYKKLYDSGVSFVNKGLDGLKFENLTTYDSNWRG